MTTQTNRAEEIVIALVVPLGVDLQRPITILESELETYGYESSIVHLSALLEGTGAPAETISEKMDLGDQYRSSKGRGDAVAALGLRHMRQWRSEHPASHRTAFIVRSLKHKDEVAMLRSVYGSRFILLGLTQDRETRLRHVVDTLRRENFDYNQAEPEAERLLIRDESDPSKAYGQDVRNTYSKADYFVDCGSGKTGITDQLRRFLGLVFGEPYLTPTRDELAMYIAFATSLRSADSTRQVGAALTTPAGELISVGTNEVPRAGGGEYWTGDKDDARDFHSHSDENLTRSWDLLHEILNVLDGQGALAPTFARLGPVQQREQLLDPRMQVSLRQTRITGLLEFSRVVHAEMAAITATARSSHSSLGTTLYTTAFPCHLCMRLIISSGVARVVYVDPYPKSLSLALFSDSTTTRELTNGSKVVVSAFEGAGWNLFTRAFQASGRQRLDTGRLESPRRADARFMLAEPESALSIPERELHILRGLDIDDVQASSA